MKHEPPATMILLTRLLQRLLILTAAAAFITPSAIARSWRPGQIPNGEVYGCYTCHVEGGARNLFGLAVEARVAAGSEAAFWSSELAALDSDGDGFTNGEELGDPDGDGIPTSGIQIAHPGDPASPGISKVSRVTTTGAGLALEWQYGVQPYLVQQRALDPDARWTDVLTTDTPRAVLPRDAISALLRVQPSSRRRVQPLSVWLHGAAVRPESVSTEASGIGSVLVQERTLTVRVRFSGLSANATGAQIYGPAGMDEVADVLVPLSGIPDSRSGAIETTIPLSSLTSEQLSALLTGRAYLTIGTSAYPEGEIRGQIAPLQLRANLGGGAVRPAPVTTTGTGSARFWLVGDELTGVVNYANLSAPAIAAHLHGPADTEGSAGVLIPFELIAGQFGNSGTFSGTATITAEQLRYLLEGLVYLNIHTDNHPDGEIRGQVIR